MDIHADRLWNRLSELGRIGSYPDGSITRLSCTKEDAAARDWLIGEMRSAGLEVYVDAVGNVIEKFCGEDTSAPAVITGSHYDTVRHGGRFDGEEYSTPEDCANGAQVLYEMLLQEAG